MKLRDFLDRPGVTASSLAKLLDVSHTTVLRWADGSISPSLESMQRLHDLTSGQVTPNDFLKSTTS